MSTAWPKARVGEVLERSTTSVAIVPDQKYSEITVKLWGKGVVLRGNVSGADIGGTRRFVAKAGQFILSRIDARNGATGIVPPNLDGAVVSNDFPLFDIASTKLEPALLGWLTKTHNFVELCQRASEGTTNRVRLQEDRFLDLEIPLPSLVEQRRLVARIEELSTKISEAKGLRQQAAEEAEVLLASQISHIFEEGERRGWTVGRLGDYVADDCYGTSEKTTNDDSGVPILRMGNIQNGQLDLRNLKYLQLSEKDRARLLLNHGDILVNRTNSAELVGKCAVFEAEGDFSFASYLIRLRLNQERATPRLVAAYVNSPRGRAYMLTEKRQMTGQANVNATKLKALPIALPSVPEQWQIIDELDRLQAKVESVKRLQNETAAEFNAMLPAILDRAFRGAL